MSLDDARLTAIAENSIELSNAWMDVGIGGGDAMVWQAIIGYADSSWGNADALAAGFLAAAALTTYITQDLDKNGPNPAVAERRGAASMFVPMFNLLLSKADRELANHIAMVVARIIEELTPNMNAILVNRAEVPNR